MLDHELLPTSRPARLQCLVFAGLIFAEERPNALQAPTDARSLLEEGR